MAATVHTFCSWRSERPPDCLLLTRSGFFILRLVQ
jgi:hypothetical protein